MPKGNLFIVSGPSAVGKDSVLEKMRENGMNFHFLVTTTSRTPRSQETEGNPYHFVSKERFEELIREDGLLEWANVYGNYYGSAKSDMEKALENNDIVILRIDPQGAETVRKKISGSKVIFIAPPSTEALESRIRRRGEDGEEAIIKRMETVKKDMENMERWDCIIVNEENKLEEAAKKVMEYMASA